MKRDALDHLNSFRANIYTRYG